jgi:hypothetical protein
MTSSSCSWYWTINWTFNLWLQWRTYLGKTSWPTNRSCEVCDQKCAHSSNGNYENHVKEVKFSIVKLESHFSSHGVMEVLGVVFRQYWMMENYEESFKKHIVMIKAQYCYLKRMGLDPTLVPKVLSFMSLDLQMLFFK